MLKRACTGTFDRISPKRLQRHVSGFAGRHKLRESNTRDQMGNTVGRDLIADNGLSNLARS